MKKLVVKDNALIEASHRLGGVEQRLVLLAIVKARSIGNTVEQLKDQMLTIHADEYIANFGGTRQGAYKALKQAVMGLYRAEWGYKYLTEKNEQRVRYERFTQSADYGEGEGTVQFMFSNAIIPMLVELEKRFTTYEIEQVAQLSSSYAMRLYEFCIQHLDKRTGKGWLEISLDELRFRFGLLTTEYTKMGNFKARVLDYSIDELNKNTDISIGYEQRKQGRVIVGFRFEFKKKMKKTQVKQFPSCEETPQKTQSKTIDLFKNFSDIERETLIARVNAYIAQLENKGEIVSDFHRKNITKKAVEERWGLDVLAKKQAKAKATQERKAKKQAEQQVEKDKKAKSRQELEQRKALVMTKFENLAPEQRDYTLHEIAKRIGKGAFEPIFKTAMKEGTAHTDERFTSYFYEYFGFDL